MRRFFSLPVSFALAVTSAYAQPITPPLTPPPAPTVALPVSAEPEISPETLVQRALQNSPRLQIARENLSAAQGRAQSLRALPGPTLQLVPGFSGSRDARDEEITLAQPLDLFGARRAIGKVGAAQVRRAQAENRLAARALEIEVKGAAAQLFAAQEAEKLEIVQLEIARLFRDAAQKRAALGDVPPIQVQRAELEVLRLENDLENARATRLRQRAALNTLIGTAPNAPLQVVLPLDAGATALLRANAPLSTQNIPAPLPIDAPATSATSGGALISPDAISADLAAPDLALRPDLAGARASLEARQAQLQALNRARLPQVELQLRRAPFLGQKDGSTAFRAVITVPLFDFGALKGERRAAQAEVRAQTASLQLQSQRAAAQVETARATLQNRRDNSRRYQTQILPLTLDLLRKTQIGYAQGASTYLEVLEAQRVVRQVQTEYLQALVTAQTGEIALDAALNGGTTDGEAPFAGETR